MKTDAARQRWTEAAELYDVPHLRLRQIARLVAQLAPGGRLGDVGCSAGQLRELCPGHEYVGCDFVATGTTREFPFFLCDFNREPLPAQFTGFDLLVCSGALEYVERLPDFLTQLRGRLLPGGHLIVSYFNMNHLSRLMALARGESFRVHPDWRGFHSPGAFEALLCQAGFSVEARYISSRGWGSSPAVNDTIAVPADLHPAGRWSRWLGHQFIFVARIGAGPA